MAHYDGIEIGRAQTSRRTRSGGTDGEVTIRILHKSGRKAIVKGQFVFAERRPPRVSEPLWEAKTDGDIIVRGVDKRTAIAAAIAVLQDGAFI